MEAEVEAAQPPWCLSRVGGELGLPASPQHLTEFLWKRELFCSCPRLVMLQQELGAAAIHPWPQQSQDPSWEWDTIWDTVPEIITHVLSCLFLCPSVSLCHPEDAGTWHSLGPCCHLTQSSSVVWFQGCHGHSQSRGMAWQRPRGGNPLWSLGIQAVRGTCQVSCLGVEAQGLPAAWSCLNPGGAEANGERPPFMLE